MLKSCFFQLWRMILAHLPLPAIRWVRQTCRDWRHDVGLLRDWAWSRREEIPIVPKILHLAQVRALTSSGACVYSGSDRVRIWSSEGQLLRTLANPCAPLPIDAISVANDIVYYAIGRYVYKWFDNRRTLVHIRPRKSLPATKMRGAKVVSTKGQRYGSINVNGNVFSASSGGLILYKFPQRKKK